jgi:O-antigen/teichoic acid export membrane protein
MAQSEAGSLPRAPSFLISLLATGASEGIARLSQLGVIALVARDLGAAGFGVFGIAWSVEQMALAFVQIGPEMVGVRAYGQGGDRHRLAVSITYLKLVMALVALPIMVGAVALLYGTGSAITDQAIIQGLVMIPIALSNGWILRAASHFGDFALLRVGQSLLFLAALVAVLHRWPVPLAIPITEGTVTLIAVLAFWRRSMAHANTRDDGDNQTVRDLLHGSLALGFSTLCSTLLWTACVPISGLFLTTAETGIVAQISRILAAVNGLCQIFIQVFYPALVRRYAVDVIAGAHMAGSLFVLIFAASVALVAGLALTSGWVIPTLLGHERIDAIPLFCWWLPTLIPAASGSIFGYALMATGHITRFTLISTASSIGVVIITVAAYAVFPDPRATAAMTLIMIAGAVAMGVAAFRAGLVSTDRGIVSVLGPRALRRFLNER